MGMYEDFISGTNRLSDVLSARAKMDAEKEQQAQAFAQQKQLLREKAAMEQEQQAKDIETIRNLKEQGLGDRSIRVGNVSVGDQPIRQEDPLKAMYLKQRQEEEERRKQQAQTSRLEHAARASEKMGIPSTLNQMNSLNSLLDTDPKTGAKKAPQLSMRARIFSPGIASLLGAPEKDIRFLQAAEAVKQAYQKGQFGSQFTKTEHDQMNKISGNAKFYTNPELLNNFLKLIESDTKYKQRSAETGLLPEDLPKFREGLGYNSGDNIQPQQQVAQPTSQPPQSSEKHIVKIQENKKTGQKRIIYSDGTMEIK